jgi:NitT/TauT family transport system ATP-binding protein
MHQLLQRIWLRDRKTVVFVTHDVREALVLGDRVVVMAARPGRVLHDLDVSLPRPRDPDDPRLVELSRWIRAELRETEAGTRERAGAAPPGAEGDERGRVGEGRGGPGGVAPDLGAPL